jgi:hypothetical protein
MKTVILPSLMILALCDIKEARAQTVSQKAADAVARLQKLPENSHISGTVKTIFHRQNEPPAQVSKQMADIGAIAVALKNSLAITDETFSGEHYICSTSMFSDVSEADPKSSEPLFTETVVQDSTLVASEHVSSRQVNYSLGLKGNIERVQKQVCTAGKAISLSSLDQLTLNANFAKPEDWQESTTQGVLLISANVRKTDGELAGVVSFQINSKGLLRAASLSRSNGEHRTYPIQEFEFEYDETSNYPTQMKHITFYSPAPDVEPVKDTTQIVSITIKQLDKNKAVPTVKEFLELKSPNEVIDLRSSGQRVPFSNIAF